MVRLDTWTISAAAVLVALVVPGAASAQKNSGPLLSDPAPYRAPSYPPPVSRPPAYAPPAYAPPAYAPPAYAPPAYTPAPPRAQAPAAEGANPDAARLAQSLPLDPQTRGLQNQMPPDPHATERRLGLREPRGSATDLRGRTPSPRDIVDALAPR